MQTPYEKRKKERVKTRVKVKVAPQEAGEIKLCQTTGLDVSVGGLAFLCDREFAAGTPLRVELPLPTTTIHLNSTVVWAEPTASPEQWKVAVRFESLTDDYLRLLGSFVKEEGRKQLLDHGPTQPSSAPLRAKPIPASHSAVSAKPQTKTSAAVATATALEVRRLKRGEEGFVTAFLNRDPLRNVVLLGAVRDYGLESAYHRGSFYGCFRQEKLIGVALIGRHAILSGSEETVAVFANIARLGQEPAPQMALGDAAMIEKFCQLLAQPPCHLTVRLTQLQILYTMTKKQSGYKIIKGLRLARTDEREEVAQIHASVCREDTGVDPLAQDPIGFRRRILMRIERGREWVWRDAHGIAFKTDVIFETDEAIYLEGVWVRPDLREAGLGLGSALLKSLCQRLLRHHNGVCIFADGDDEQINAFYQKVGFEAAAPYRVARFNSPSEP